MNPRNVRWILGVAFLVLAFLGLSPLRGVASVMPLEHSGPDPTPFNIVDPPIKGGGEPTDGGDPDEVVIFIVTPGEPGVVTGATKSPGTTPSKLSTALAEIRALLFWASVVR